MQNKKIFIIVGIAVIIIGIFLWLVLHKDTSSNNNNNQENNEVQKEPLSLEEATEMANSLYAEEGKSVEVIEENEYFVIYVKNSISMGIEFTFHLDKETGIISEEPKFVQETATSS